MKLLCIISVTQTSAGFHLKLLVCINNIHYILCLLCSLPINVARIDTPLTSAFTTWVLSVHLVDLCSQWGCPMVVFCFVGQMWNRVLLPLQHLSQILECIVNKVLWCQRVHKRAGLLYKYKTKIEPLSLKPLMLGTLWTTCADPVYYNHTNITLIIITLISLFSLWLYVVYSDLPFAVFKYYLSNATEKYNVFHNRVV